MAHPDTTVSPGRSTNPLIRLLDTIGSIWFGVTMLLLIFTYSFVGSAVPLVRQGVLADVLGIEALRFEKSDMEWFAWWPFVAMVALFCVSIIIVTLRRIRLTVLNAGVWAIHTGIVMMCVACLYYFGTKVEGDTMIFQSLARIRVPGAPEATLVIRPGAETTVGAGGSHYHLRVGEVNPAYTPLSGRLKGRRSSQVWINVTSDGPAGNFIRTMIVGDPENTEDVITGAGGMQRAVNVLGRKLIDENLQIVLDYDPVRYFYQSHELPVRSNGAIYMRPVGTAEWTQLRVERLPHFYEHLVHQSEVWPLDGQPMPPIRPLSEAAVPEAGADWLKGVSVRVTDYLPYAEIQRRFVEDASGASLNPMLSFRLDGGAPGPATELLAADPSRSQVELMQGFSARFQWVANEASRAELVRPRDTRIKVRVESKNVEKELKFNDLVGAGEVALEGTDYRLKLGQTFGQGQLQPGSPPMVIMKVMKGADSFDRLLIEGDTAGGRDMTRLNAATADPDIKLEYLDAISPGLLFVGGPDSDKIDVVRTSFAGDRVHTRAAVGESVNVLPSAAIRIESMLASVREEVRPMIVPKHERQSLRDLGKKASLVRVEINDGQRIVGEWLPFNEFPWPDEQRAQPGRTTPYRSRVATLAGGPAGRGRMVELMYSRQREPLAAPVVLDRFILETHPGGDREADFISKVRFAEGGQWSPLLEIRSNQPAQHGDYWYFQSRWDPNTECHTVLGVGNRNGVGGMLAGVCISIAGMIYAFYIKPAIIRRRKRVALALAAVRMTSLSGANGSGEGRLPTAAPAAKPSKMTRV